MRATGVSVRGILSIGLVALALLLASCGGGGGGGGGGGSASSLALLAGDMGGAGSVDGTGVAARFNFPAGVAIDRKNHLILIPYLSGNAAEMNGLGRERKR